MNIRFKFSIIATFFLPQNRKKDLLYIMELNSTSTSNFKVTVLRYTEHWGEALKIIWYLKTITFIIFDV